MASKKKLIKEVDKVLEDVREKTFAESIQFEIMMWIRGKDGVWIINKKPNIHGVTTCSRFMSKETTYTNMKKLICLAHLDFHLKGGKTVKIRPLFDNLFNFDQTKLHKIRVSDVMEIMLPGYDPKKFSQSDAIKVMQWYYEIKAKIDSILRYTKEDNDEIAKMAKKAKKKPASKKKPVSKMKVVK